LGIYEDEVGIYEPAQRLISLCAGKTRVDLACIDPHPVTGAARMQRNMLLEEHGSLLHALSLSPVGCGQRCSASYWYKRYSACV
jgi:hypothetical protein